MRRISRSFVLAVLAFCLTPGLVPVALSQSTGSYSWRFAPIDVPGATRTYARTMSSTGQIVGDYDSSGVTRGFLFSDGAFTPIQLGASNDARGINSQGAIVGWMFDRADGNRGYLLSAGAVTEIRCPGASTTVPQDLNDSGDVVGQCLIDNVLHGFLWRNGNLTVIDYPGSLSSGLRGINPTGDMVGMYTVVDPDGTTRAHGFAYTSDGMFTTIDGPADPPNATLNGINPQGDIVGEYAFAGVSLRFGFVLSKGVYATFIYPGATITRPWKITADGQHIVGFYDDLHGFVVSRKSPE